MEKEHRMKGISFRHVPTRIEHELTDFLATKSGDFDSLTRGAYLWAHVWDFSP